MASQSHDEISELDTSTETCTVKFTTDANESHTCGFTSCETDKNKNFEKHQTRTPTWEEQISKASEHELKECTWNSSCGNIAKIEEKIDSREQFSKLDETEQETILQKEYKLSIHPKHVENQNDKISESLTQEEIKNDKRKGSRDKSFQQMNETSPQRLTNQKSNNNVENQGDLNIKTEVQYSDHHSLPEDLSPQRRRSARTIKKPIRYSENFAGTEKRPKKSENCKSDLKSSPKGTLNTRQKANTPKACSKVLFQNVYSMMKCKESTKKKKDPLEELMREWEPLSPPQKSLLTLNDMTVENVIATLETHKSSLDVLFSKLHKKDFVTQHEGIDHYLVMNLLPNDIQKSMMEKLSELYEEETTPKYGSHFINVLMPEWILGIFADRYELSRDQTITLVKEQNVYLGEMFGQVHKESIP